MSGHKSSERQWVSGRVRALLAVLLALSMLMPMAISVYAGDDGTALAEPVAKDKVCVTGSVITWDEYPLYNPYPELDKEDRPQDYWVIEYYPASLPKPSNPFTTTTNYDPDFKTDAQKATFKVDPGNLSVGVWTFEIKLVNEWVGVTKPKFDVPIDFGETKCQQIRFKLKRPVPVYVYKIDDLHNPLEDWEMKASPTDKNWFAIPVTGTTDAAGVTPPLLLTDGPWNFTEKAPKKTDYHPIMPSTGEQDLWVSWTEWAYGTKHPESYSEQIPIDQREPIQLRFKNYITERGCIEAYKYDVPPEEAVARGPSLYPGAFGLPDWAITLKKANGEVIATKYTDATGKVKFDKLAYGPYTVVEERQNGWAPATSTSFEVVISSDKDNCQQVEFYNKQDWPYCIQGRKVDTNGLVGIPGWKITIKPLDKGGAEPIKNDTLPINDPNVFDDKDSKSFTYTDGLGEFRFNFPKDDYRVPGGKYEICEEEKDGWLPHTALCQTVYVPTHPGACAKAWDFENQQVGHWETVIYGRPQTHPSYSDGSCNYVTAQPGNSLCGIGAAYGVSCGAMFAANPWIYNRPNHYLYSGDQVCVP